MASRRSASRVKAASTTDSGICGFRRGAAASAYVLLYSTGDAPLLHFADLAPVMLDQHPELAQRHVLRWLGENAEFLKA